MNSIDAWLPVILRDFQGTSAEAAGVRLLDLDPDHPAAHCHVITDPSSWIDPDDRTRHQLLLIINQNVTSLDPTAETVGLAVDPLAGSGHGRDESALAGSGPGRPLGSPGTASRARWSAAVGR